MLIKSVWIICLDISRSVWICFEICLDLFGYLFGSSRISVLITFWVCSLALLLGASGPSAAFWKQGLLARMASSSRDACSYPSRQRRALKSQQHRWREGGWQGPGERHRGRRRRREWSRGRHCKPAQVGLSCRECGGWMEGWSENKTS